MDCKINWQQLSNKEKREILAVLDEEFIGHIKELKTLFDAEVITIVLKDKENSYGF